MIHQLLEALLEAAKTKFSPKSIRDILYRDLRGFEAVDDDFKMEVAAPFDAVESELLVRGWRKIFYRPMRGKKGMGTGKIRHAEAPIYSKRVGERVAMVYLGPTEEDAVTYIVPVEQYEAAKRKR